jgi:hypothetical protein
MRDGGVEYRPVPFGRISRERLARHIVGLIEKPRRALFISRVYEVPVLLNKLFPEIVDWVSATWVRRKQRKELPPSEQITPVHYLRSLSVWHIAGSVLMLTLAAKLCRRKP